MDRWPDYAARYNNIYLLVDHHNAFRMISRVVHAEFGVPTIFRDLSSNYPVRVDPITLNGDNGHPNVSHSMGGGADPIFHGWPVAWNVSATWRWLDLAKKCFPRLEVYMGSMEKAALERVAGKRLDWIQVADDGIHVWSLDLCSHFHLFLLLGGFEISKKGVKTLLELVSALFQCADSLPSRGIHR